MHHEIVEVIVVGAGPVGMTVAGFLGQQGIKTLLIERNAGICLHPRAQTVDDEAMRTLQALGVADAFIATTLAAQGSLYYRADGECFAEVGPGPQNYGFPRRNYMLQQHLESNLLLQLEALDSVTLVFNQSVSSMLQQSDGVEIETLSGNRYRGNYLLACDGGQSHIRSLLGIEMRGQTYEKDWIVLDVEDDPDTCPVSRFYCDPDRPAVSIASPGGGRRYEFMLADGEDSQRILDDATLKKVLAPYRRYDPEKVTRRAVYRFHARMAERLRDERVLLLGDAAHLSPPFAGQGMNAGIRDAHNVAWKMALHLRAGISDSILNSYESERRDPIWAMIQLAVAMGEFVMPVGKQQIALTESVMMALNRFPEAHDWVFQMKFKPKPRYTQGLFLGLENPEFEASLVGEMIPQPMVQIDGEKGAVALDNLLGSGFSAIAQNDAGEKALLDLQHPLWTMLNPVRLRLHDSNRSMTEGQTSSVFVPAATASSGEDVIQACWHSDQYVRPFRTHRDQLMLVRPDRYVAGCCFPEQLDEFASQYLRVLADK